VNVVEVSPRPVATPATLQSIASQTLSQSLWSAVVNFHGVLHSRHQPSILAPNGI
jgi:hypothetical protein